MALINTLRNILKNKYGSGRIATADEILSAVYNPETNSQKEAA